MNLLVGGLGGMAAGLGRHVLRHVLRRHGSVEAVWVGGVRVEVVELGVLELL